LTVHGLEGTLSLARMAQKESAVADKSVVIVGAGIAGLSAATYAQRSGYRTTLLEMHDIPGGLCTAWKRKGYTFDISMHMFTGVQHGPLHQMWDELGVFEGLRFVHHKEVGRLEGLHRTLIFTPDRKHVEDQMLAISPDDAKLIRELLDLMFGRMMMDMLVLTPDELLGLSDRLRRMATMAPMLPKVMRYGRMTVQEFALRFKDPFLREAVRLIIDTPGWPMPRFPMLGLCGLMPGAASEFGVPIGGSMHVALGIADRFKKAGGELRCKARVKDVMLEGDRASGVRLEDDSELRADAVIWAADGHTLIFDVLKGRYVDEPIRRMYDTWTPVIGLVHVALGVNRDMTNEPRGVSIELQEPITIAGEKRRWMQVIHHSFDPTMAPEGKSAVEVWWPSRLEYWKALVEDKPRYEAEKKKIADATIAELDKRWSGMATQIEEVDVPTPATYVRYTGNWQASPDGWYITPENMSQSPRISLPGLSGLYMAGQWTAPFAGTPISSLSGRQAVQLMCKRHGETFRPTA
jgi:phytoene dehydrogenase-like protein